MIDPGYPRSIGSRLSTLSWMEQQMPIDAQGLPAARSVEQAIVFAQLQILRRLETQRSVAR